MTTNDPTVTISIGIPSDPTGPGHLSDDRWLQFREDLKAAARSRAADGVLHFRGEGSGSYRDDSGALHEELSYTVVFTLHEDCSKDDLRNRVRSLARSYGQECIALTFGSTELIG